MSQAPDQKLTLTLGRQITCALGILLAGIAVRYRLLDQSLWYDEMTTLTDYVMQPWARVLAAGRGEYVANNHVLHTILAKLFYTASGDPLGLPAREMMLRLPAFFAGVAVPFALVWPLRKSDPWLALALALVTSLHPWLVASSIEARGYSLMLLLGILATNCLPTEKTRWPIAYAMLVALAVYTVPLALILIPAHAVAIWILRRPVFRVWNMAAAIAIVLACLMYLPMTAGLISYYRHPYASTRDYRQFLDALPRYALAGSDSVTAIDWALPVIAIVMGSVLGWSRVAMRPLLITFGAATLLGIFLPLVLVSATEPRFVQWILPWFCLSITAALFSARARWGRAAGVIGFISLVGWQALQDVNMLPNQPIREGFTLTGRIVPPDRDIMVLYIGARESIALYGDRAGEHQLLPAFSTEDMHQAERRAMNQTHHLPWAIIFFEGVAASRDQTDDAAHGMWSALRAHYHLAAPRLAGRITPVAIYAPDVP